MPKITIDSRVFEFTLGETILDIARKNSIEIPTLCHLKGLNEIGSCKVCVVEVEGHSRLRSSCNTKAKDGDVVFTANERVLDARKNVTELIMSEHDGACKACSRDENCPLQDLANEFGVLQKIPYKKHLKKNLKSDFPLQRKNSKCIECMRCIQVCNKVQGLGVWDVLGTGTNTCVGVTGGIPIEDANCSLCAQCITHCPTGALSERDDTKEFLAAVANTDKTVVLQIAPAVRAAWGEGIGLSREDATVPRMIAAARSLGVDYVFDTDFAADLTIMEEGSELLKRLGSSPSSSTSLEGPSVQRISTMFTSCCPGWMRFVDSEYPMLKPNLSTAKSPQQMFGAIAKTYFAQKQGLKPEDIVCVSIMPCVAKKDEATLYDSTGTGPDVDIVLTTREFDRLLKKSGIDVSKLADDKFDQPLGESTGASVIFGVTGGVMEAALRSAYFLVTGSNPDPDAFSELRYRGSDEIDVNKQSDKYGWHDATFDINGTSVRIAVANGLGNTRRLIEAILKGEVEYDFVEIMACPGGCVGGGGQPIKELHELAAERAPKLYSLDKNAQIRFSHENPAVKALYNDFLGSPLSELSHKLLHR